jgi:hypothetical protein
MCTSVRVIQLAIFNQTGADGEFRQFHEDCRLAGECRCVSSRQRVPAPIVCQLQRARRYRGEFCARPRLRLSTQGRNVTHGRLVRCDSLQLSQNKRQLAEKVLLCHLHSGGSSLLAAQGDATPVGVGRGRPALYPSLLFGSASSPRLLGAGLHLLLGPTECLDLLELLLRELAWDLAAGHLLRLNVAADLFDDLRVG